MEESRVTAQKQRVKIAECCLGHPQSTSCWFTARVMLCVHTTWKLNYQTISWKSRLDRSYAQLLFHEFNFSLLFSHSSMLRARFRPIGSEKQFEFIIFVSSILNSLEKVYVTHCINWLNSVSDTRRHKEKQGKIVCDSCVISHMLDCRDRAHKLAVVRHSRVTHISHFRMIILTFNPFFSDWMGEQQYHVHTQIATSQN